MAARGRAAFGKLMLTYFFCGLAETSKYVLVHYDLKHPLELQEYQVHIIRLKILLRQCLVKLLLYG
jgi:hypothetical protein